MKKIPKIALIIISGAIGFIVLICLLGMAIGGLSGSKATTPTATPPIQAQSTEIPAPTIPPATEQPIDEETRCVPASQGQIDRIRSGVKAIDTNNDIREVWAVKSTDYSNVWFVAAKIYGSGIENGTPEAAIWAINGDPQSPGITLSVDGFAKQFSDWPDGSTTDAKTTMQDDGALEAQTCARK